MNIKKGNKKMKDLSYLDKYRINLYGSIGDEYNGAFEIYFGGKTFFIVASNGKGWEHISVSIRNSRRCPTWEEMCKIKDMFFNDDEVVVQFHPAKKDYVNNHKNCLHLWKPLEHEIQTPPKILV